MHRTGSCLLILLLLLALTACGGPPAEPVAGLPLDHSLIRKSAALTRIMGELASDPGYYSTMSDNSDIKDVIDGIAGTEYGTPVSALVLPIPDNFLDSLYEEMDASLDVSDTARDILNRRMVSATASIIAGRQGTMYIAATSILSISDSYQLAPGLEGGVLVILFYEGDHCSLTGFIPGQEDTMMAFASFVPAEPLQGDNLSQMLEYLTEYGITTEEPRQYEGGDLSEILELE